MNEVPLHHIRRSRREVAVERIDCIVGCARVVAQRMNGVLRNRRCTRRGGLMMIPLMTMKPRGIGIAEMFRIVFPVAVKFALTIVNSIHVVGANNVIGDRTGRRSANGVVINRSGWTRCVRQCESPGTQSPFRFRRY